MKPRRAARPAAGFALVIVLWVLAGLTVVAVAVASSLRTSAESVKLLRDRVRAEAAFISTGSRVRMILATAGAGRNAYDSARGLVFADGRPTRVGDAGDEWIAVQDLRGLVALNRPSDARLRRLLEACGAPQATTAALVDALNDYADRDTLKRLNGAEAFEYAGTALPPPRNAPLLSREELWRVFGWDDVRAAWAAAGCGDLVTVRGDGLFNRNTAPMRALLADGLDPAAAASLVSAREGGIVDLTLQTASPERDSNPFNFSGGGAVGPAVRLTHTARWVEWSLELEVELTPTRDGGPWRLHEVRTLPARPPSAAPAASLPPAAFWNPERESALNDARSRLPFGN